MDNNIKFWNRASKVYTIMQEKSNGKFYNAVIQKCRKYINENSEVLELACGTGQYTFSLCSDAKSWCATDFSAAMVEKAEKRGRTLNSSAVFSVQDATCLTYEGERFDTVLIANAFHIMPEPDKAIAEIVRVLRPGGILLAPNFVYEGKINRIRMKAMNKVGFKTFYEWNADQYTDFIIKSGFSIKEKEVMPGNPIPEMFVAAEKKNEL